METSAHLHIYHCIVHRMHEDIRLSIIVSYQNTFLDFYWYVGNPCFNSYCSMGYL